MKKYLILYMPVLHNGYRELVARHLPDKVFLLSEKFTTEIEYLLRDIRAVPPVHMSVSFHSLLSYDHQFDGVSVRVLQNEKTLHSIRETDEIIMPDEDISRLFASKFLQGRKIIWDTAFCRWDMNSARQEFPVDPDEEVTESEFVQGAMREAFKEAEKSPDFWRQVGAILHVDGTTLRAHNRHVPHPYIVYMEGDPRTPFLPGERIELSSAEHAEANIIATAARKGIALQGAAIFVTTFPCPACAKLIVTSGIKCVAYTEGYSLVNAREIFRKEGVKLIRVKM